MTDSTPRADLAAPVPTDPEAGAVVTQDAVTFRWVAPPGATVFDLRIASASDPDTLLVELADLPTTETTLALALPAGDLLWWVRQRGGAWSAATAFRAGTPADVEVVRKREAVTSVETRKVKREVGIAPVPDAPPAPVWPHPTGETLEGAPPPEWASVPGFSDAGHPEVALANAAAPQPLAPLGGEVVDAVSVSLRWTPVEGATGYDVELSPHADFSHEVLALNAGQATEIGLPGLVPALGWKLLWRVRARLGDRATPWSLYGRFYPAGSDSSDRFRAALEEARAAKRRQLDHARMAREREMDLMPTHEREDAVTDTATYLGFLGVAATMVVFFLLAFAYTMWRAAMM